MLAQIRNLIALIRGKKVTAADTLATLQLLLKLTETLKEKFSDAQGTTANLSLITIERERRLFSNWLTFQQKKLTAAESIIRTLIPAAKRDENINPAPLAGLETQIGGLLDAVKSKRSSLMNSSKFSYEAGKTTVLDHVNQLLSILDAPLVRDDIIPTDISSSFPKALEDFQPQIDDAQEKLEDEGRETYSCFLSYAWGNKAYEDIVARIAAQLEEAGLEVHFDRWADVAGKNIQEFVSKIDRVDWVVVFGSQLYQQKYNRTATYDGDSEHILRAEVVVMNAVMMQSTRRANRIIPVLLEGSNATSLPQPFFMDKIAINLGEGRYVDHIMRLIRTLYNIPPEKRYTSSTAASSSSATGSPATSESTTTPTNYPSPAGLFDNAMPVATTHATAAPSQNPAATKNVNQSHTVRQAFNMQNVAQDRGIHPDVKEQMDKARQASLTMAKYQLLQSALSPDDVASLSMQTTIEDTGNTSFAPAHAASSFPTIEADEYIDLGGARPQGSIRARRFISADAASLNSTTASAQPSCLDKILGSTAPKP
jgi:TIR domain